MTKIAGFYGINGEFGCFSNFSRHSFVIGGKTWKTVEHYFQAQKFSGTEHEEKIRGARYPGEAKNIGNDRSLPLRKDWEQVKESVMYDALKAKFTQHEDIKNILLSTVGVYIVEQSPYDYYWGCGDDDSGKNRLGFLLMKLRDELVGAKEK